MPSNGYEEAEELFLDPITLMCNALSIRIYFKVKGKGCELEITFICFWRWNTIIMTIFK